MDVTLLYFADCPNWIETSDHLGMLASEFQDIVITRRIVETVEQAERAQFRGSPSILIDGEDPFAEPDAPVGLSCRLYQTPSGSAGSPTLEQLRIALEARRPR